MEAKHARLPAVVCSWFVGLAASAVFPAWVVAAALDDNRLAGGEPAIQRPVDQRFAGSGGEEQPDFQRHVAPLLGRLGCNGRACHGSFQGQGGFRLSLFGYDFRADHEALTGGDEPRVATQHPAESLILRKPTSADEHEGGQRFAEGSWQYHVLRRWIEAGAPFDPQRVQELARLEVTPSEVVFQRKGQSVRLRVVAVWADGSSEDVTPLCLFHSRDDQLAVVDDSGQVTAGDAGDTHVVVTYDRGVVPIPVLQPVSELVGPAYPQVETPTQVDRLVVDKLRRLGLVPSELADDATFLRRVSLDLAGSLPSAEQVERFLADRSPDKRQREVERLLASPEYAAWWTTRLCDITGNNAEALANVSLERGTAAQQWYDWIYRRVAENVPYDQIVAGIVTAVSREDGQGYRDYSRQMSDYCRGDADFAERKTMPHYWARRNVRLPEERAIGFAYAFLGVRIECAQCHKHPFDQWSQEDFNQFKSFFTGLVAANGAVGPDRREFEQMVSELGLASKNGGQLRKELASLLEDGRTVPFPEVALLPRPRANPARKAEERKNERRPGPSSAGRLLGGNVVDLTAYEDPRQPLSDWLCDAENPYFARALVNRVWSWYFNVGIVEPPDDLSLGNPPSNGPLLDYLTRGFIESGFDLKWLHRQITFSRTYQSSWQPNETNARDARNFSRAVPRRLPAEVAYDAVRLATAADVAVEQMHRDPVGSQRAIASAGPRDRNPNGPNYGLQVFGRSKRESNCDCDRSNDPSLLQTVYLQNDPEVLAAIAGRGQGWLAQVSREVGGSPPLADPSAARSRPEDYEERVAALERRIAQLRRQGDEERADQARRRLAELTERFGGPGPARAAASPRKADVEHYVRQAYLRTLSRDPDPDELARARSFLDAAPSLPAGLGDLLWALVNTKEFIVNH